MKDQIKHQIKDQIKGQTKFKEKIVQEDIKPEKNIELKDQEGTCPFTAMFSGVSTRLSFSGLPFGKSAVFFTREKVLKFLIFLTIDLMLLGAFVRAYDAGLACPDWPACFGKAIPEWNLRVWLEQGHRIMASVVAFIFLGLFIAEIKNYFSHKKMYGKANVNTDSKASKKIDSKLNTSPTSSATTSTAISPKANLKESAIKSTNKKVAESGDRLFFYFVAGFLLLAQIIVGALTVLSLLKANVVTAHLMLATLFLLCLFYISKKNQNNNLDIKCNNKTNNQKSIKANVSNNTATNNFKLLTLKVLGVFSVLGVLLQMTLGGLVASNYAGKLCTDFPLCHGAWVPTLSGPVGLQVMHRFMAYILVVILVGFSVVAIKWANHLRVANINKLNLKNSSLIIYRKTYIKNKSYLLIALVFLQVLVGVLNVKLFIPAWLTVTHLALAIALLKTSFDLVYVFFETPNDALEVSLD